MECCNTLQYLEGAAYIAIVLAVLGVPQMLTYYFERRDRRRERDDDRIMAERQRAADQAAAERQRAADQAEAERQRAADRAEAEQVRRAERAEADRVRREERADAERRHLEMMTALIALTDRNGNGHPTPDPSGIIAQMQQRIADLENYVHEQQRSGSALPGA